MKITAESILNAYAQGAFPMADEFGYIILATDGNTDAWFRLWQAATNGFASLADYQKVQGNNPDGSRNPAFENLIDVQNLVDYMLDIFYGGNIDAPISAFLGNTSPNLFLLIFPA